MDTVSLFDKFDFKNFNQGQPLRLRRSTIAETKIRFEGKPISFERYRFSKKILDTKANSIIFKCGRQVGKSFTLALAILTNLVTRPYCTFLYVAPEVSQAKVFSTDKIEARIRESEEFKKLYIDKTCIRSVFKKSFINESQIYFKAVTQLESIRGISSDINLYDEWQDIIPDSMGIINETMSGKDHEAYIWGAGTPKTIHNHIESTWQDSSMIIPIMVCSNKTFRHHNPPSKAMIQPDGLRCPECKARINVDDIYYKAMGDPNAKRQGFWIPQIALPVHVNNPSKWADLLYKMENLPPEQFDNESMGLSAGQGQYQISEGDLKRACSTPFSFRMWQNWQEFFELEDGTRIPSGIRELWAGLDWGHTAERSYTVLKIGGFNIYTNRFTIVYGKKFLHADPLRCVDEIAYILQQFAVTHCCPDYGGGWTANELLAKYTKDFCVVIPCFYSTEKSLRWEYKDKYQRYHASRTGSLIDIFHQIARGRFHFYSWSQLKETAGMYLAEFQESSKDAQGNVKVLFTHAANKPDDALHASNYLFGSWKAKYDPRAEIFRG
jgi:hypothetical protein